MFLVRDASPAIRNLLLQLRKPSETMSVKRYRFFGQVQEVGESGETIDAGWSVFCTWVKQEDYARLQAEVERLTDTLNKLVKTPPEATGGVRVKVDFWTQYGSRLPSSYETFWENAAKEGKQS